LTVDDDDYDDNAAAAVLFCFVFWLLFEAPSHDLQQALFRGRMANGMLQYFWNRVKADSNRWGLEPTNAQR
jgi:hypothetical protein